VGLWERRYRICRVGGNRIDRSGGGRWNIKSCLIIISEIMKIRDIEMGARWSVLLNMSIGSSSFMINHLRNSTLRVMSR